MDVNLLKKQVRKTLLGRRNALSPGFRTEANASICRRLLSLDEYKAAKTILSYSPTGSETDITAVNLAALEAGKRLALPVTAPHGIMEAYIPRNGSSLVAGPYGIAEPDVEQSELVLPEEIDLVIVPVVGFDDDFNRLGHGAGYYDRYLARCDQAVKLAVAYEAQYTEKIPVDENDISMDIIITEA